MRYGWATAQTNPATIVSGPMSWIASTRAGRRAVSLLVSSLGMLVAISELTRTSSRESLAEVRDPMQAQPQAQRREPRHASVADAPKPPLLAHEVALSSRRRLGSGGAVLLAAIRHEQRDDPTDDHDQPD